MSFWKKLFGEQRLQTPSPQPHTTRSAQPRAQIPKREDAGALGAANSVRDDFLFDTFGVRRTTLGWSYEGTWVPIRRGLINPACDCGQQKPPSGR